MSVVVGSIVYRVVVCCIVFAYFLFVPFKTRFRYSTVKVALLALLLTALTAVITVLFFIPNLFLVKYSSFGVALWLAAAVFSFHLAIKGSFLEILFTVLMVLNLYVNIVSIARVILSMTTLRMPKEAAQALIVTGVLLAYLPLLWALMVKLYKPVVEQSSQLDFWRFIWIIPTLTYTIFFVKIINDYWRRSVQTRAGDVLFIVLWAFTTYAFFCVTLQMLLQTRKRLAAIEQTNLITAQLRMQEDQYETLLEHMENAARLRHDWRHHLLSINGLAESGDTEGLRGYIRELLPTYAADAETSLCPNRIVDVILRHSMSIAASNGVTMQVSANLPALVPIPDTVLCIIFGNLVENAMEACAKQQRPDKHIELWAEMKAEQLMLKIRNTYEHRVILTNGRYYSTKHDGAGIGLASVKEVVEKNSGLLRISYDDSHFTVQVLLNAFEP